MLKVASMAWIKAQSTADPLNMGLLDNADKIINKHSNILF
eukprot:CAMPEP_0171442822 /NCGR_PEP_ID=MMETSP0881-20121228/29264_1 /TAXON_ID=67004 /ORGANISM="Thalassiosira weissflogii, Strain CCMP1336" /LENGTH=39 /DNA_ID= /DNA_START= /DNA_END= /DNA_ORIENTATION=